MIFLNFSKAFDVASHSINCIKLQMLSIISKLLLWVRDFLVSRTMCVKVADDISDPKAVTSDVPQVSVLGPVFFLI